MASLRGPFPQDEMQQRINAARVRIERLIARFDAWEESSDLRWPTERRLLEESYDLLDPEVHLA
jgi:hypothetical protein